MREKIAELIVIFGVSFILINLIGYIFQIPLFRTIIMNPNGYGGQSISNIPTILSIVITIIVGVIKYYSNK